MKLIKAIHINGIDTKKRFWILPETLEKLDIRKGDTACVETSKGEAEVEILQVFDSKNSKVKLNKNELKVSKKVISIHKLNWKFILKDSCQRKVVENTLMIRYDKGAIMNWLTYKEVNIWISPFELMDPTKGDEDIFYAYHIYDEQGNGIDSCWVGEKILLDKSDFDKLIRF